MPVFAHEHDYAMSELRFKGLKKEALDETEIR
jgi:hypothetical protein